MHRTGESKQAASRRPACIGGLLHIAYAAAVRSEAGVTSRLCASPASPPLPLGRGRGPMMRRGAPLRRRPPGGSSQGHRRG